MRIRRCPFWLLTVLGVAILGLGGQTLSAQQTLPSAVLGAQSPLSQSDQGTVNTFLNFHVARLESDSPSEVAEGRARISEQFTLSTSPHFLNYYQQALATRIAPLIEAENPLITRLNVAIISSKLTGQPLVSILQASADDASPAVRYWIAKAVGAAAKNDGFDQSQQQDVLNVLAGRLKVEDSSLVLEQGLLAIAEIDLPQAITTILQGLDARVAFHKDNPDARFKPVQNGMQQLWSKLIALRSGGTNVNKDLYELGRIAYRYYALIAEQMPEYENPADDDAEAQEAKNDKAQMARGCVQVMAYVVGDVAGIATPQPINTNVSAELAVSRDRWRDILKASPFNLPDKELSIQP